ncbi:unnamed protein product [Rotaria sp. Silwood2]|nr:unnamed protein product [Rotaria sp. Silwood2]
MQSEKHSTLEHYFLSSNKKLRNNEQQVEPSIAISSSLSTSEIQDRSSSNGLSDDNALSNCAVNNSTTPLTLSSSNEKTCKKPIPSDINSNVLKQLDNSRAILIRKNRDRLVKISSTLLFLTRQIISFRGHQEDENSSNQGNFLEFLRWASTTDPAIKSIFEDSAGNATYLSHDIQNELINIMSNEIREEISFMVR